MWEESRAEVTEQQNQPGRHVATIRSNLWLPVSLCGVDHCLFTDFVTPAVRVGIVVSFTRFRTAKRRVSGHVLVGVSRLD